MTFKPFLILFVVLSQVLIAQTETPNQTDEQGRKQGKWSGLHANGKIRYEGTFEDNNPVGVFKYYDVYGNLNTEVSNRGDSADVTFYHLNKTIMAEGKYYKQQRTGIWKFYDADGDISAQKYFENNKQNGPCRVYYKDGRISRDCFYRNGVKHGKLTDYFPEGKLKFEAEFVDGNPDGKVKHYYTHGGMKIIGFYKFAVQEGTWTYFGSDGKVERYEVYRNGFKKKSFTPEEAKQMREERQSSDSAQTIEVEPK